MLKKILLLSASSGAGHVRAAQAIEKAFKEANDEAGRIGGWREYAKEARQAQKPDAAAKPDPHAGHAKP